MSPEKSIPSIVLGKSLPDLLQEETLVDLFRKSAVDFAATTALIFGETSLTYAALDIWTDAMAAHLVGNGIKPGDAVGLWYPRSLKLHIAVLGIVKAGAAYVPLDRDMPAERVETVLEEVNAKAYISLETLSISS